VSRPLNQIDRQFAARIAMQRDNFVLDIRPDDQSNIVGFSNGVLNFKVSASF
jgi:hypothetical protein